MKAGQGCCPNTESMRSAICRLAAIEAVLLAAVVIFASAALAKRGPSLSWSLPHTANAEQPIAFTWKGRHLGRGTRLVVQKPEGTAHTWRSIMRLSGNSGSAELPALALGRYKFRLADMAGRRVLAKSVAGIAVFGEVPFSTLLSRNGGVHTTATTSFPYTAYWRRGGAQPAFQVEHNHCNFVHIAFISGPEHIASEHGSRQGVSKVTVVQETHEPVSATSPFETVGGLDANLVPGQTWAMNIAIETVEREEEWYGTYINGYAICDSAEPFK